MSIITKERLKNFNEIQGTVAGNMMDEIEAAEFVAKEDGQNEDGEGLEQEETKDRVDPLLERQSSVERVSDVRSVTTGRSRASNRTYITKLESQLAAEREARLKLEKEVEEMKKINAEISSKLGLTHYSTEPAK